MKLSHIVFMGTPEFSIPTLSAVMDTLPNTKISVFCKEDRVRGRGKTPSPCAIKKWASAQHLDIYTPPTKETLEKQVHELKPDLIIIIAYGMILPKSITDTYLCINSHASLLPQYRGPSPIHASLLNGDHKTGITLMRINERMDAGDIITQQECPITTADSLGSLFEALATQSGTMMQELITTELLTDKLQFTAQNEEEASYCKLIKKEDTHLSWDMAPETFVNTIRAFSPKPGATLIHESKRIKLIEAKLENNHVIITKVQPEGKGIMSYHDYCLGHPKGLYPHAQ